MDNIIGEASEKIIGPDGGKLFAVRVKPFAFEGTRNVASDFNMLENDIAIFRESQTAGLNQLCCWLELESADAKIGLYPAGREVKIIGVMAGLIRVTGS